MRLDAAALLDVPPHDAKGASLVRRIYVPRIVGLGLGAVCVGAALLQRDAPAWLWPLLALNAFVWPHLAYRWALTSRTPFTAEHRNLLIDSGFGAFWLPAMGFNVLPSALLLTMLTMNNFAVGGRGLFVKGLLAQLGGAAVGALLLGVMLEPAASLRTIVACLPFLVVYPLTIGFTTYQLSMRLSRQREKSERSARLHRATLDAMDAGIVLYDADDRLVLCNEDFRRLYDPLAPLLVPGLRFEDLLRAAVAKGLIPEAAGHEDEWITERLRMHRHPRAAVTRELPDGRWRRILEKRLSDGSLLAFSTDVTDLVRREHELQRLNEQRDAYAKALQEANARLEQLSDTDELTQVANRRHFDRRLREELQRGERTALPLALLLIDVDHFKRFNDAHGHPRGDACLRHLARTLRESAQRPTDLVARYGGEEFAMLLPNTGGKEAQLVAQRCMQAMAEAAIPHGDSPLAPFVTLSIGVAVASPGAKAEDAAALVREADAALYAAKRAGRHCVRPLPADVQPPAPPVA